MKIGEFAQATGLPISALRHYDKEGLLNPDFIDNFTGYRYYSLSQLERVRRITLLKQTGLSLKEIREILDSPEDTPHILKILDGQRARYQNMLTAIEEVKQVMLNEKENINKKGNPQASFQGTKPDRGQDEQIFIEHEGDSFLFKTLPLHPSENPGWFVEGRAFLETEISKRDYQRISGFMTYGEKDSDIIQIAARAVPLGAAARTLMEDISLPFENDEAVIGRWQVIGEYAVEDDFFADFRPRESGDGGKKREIYFLPDGQEYWIYSWTKGYLKTHTGDGKYLSRYHLRKYRGRTYMFLEHKSYEYRRGGLPTTLVLEQLDHRAYTMAEISRKDNVNIPYVRDERVLGDWKAVDFINCREDFSPAESHRPPDSLFFKHMHFGENGEVTSQYGKKLISGKSSQSWTKGYVLRYWNHTACAYEIVTVDGVDYMIIEWKSGDYIWGGFDTNYYVFVREDAAAPQK